VQVAEEVSREGEVTSSNPADHVAANFARKMPRLATFNEFHGIKSKLTWRSIDGKLMKILLDEIKFIKIKLVYTIFNTYDSLE
jgi:hypothetical protein